jgi:hypothetical protein
LTGMKTLLTSYFFYRMIIFMRNKEEMERRVAKEVLNKWRLFRFRRIVIKYNLATSHKIKMMIRSFKLKLRCKRIKNLFVVKNFCHEKLKSSAFTLINKVVKVKKLFQWHHSICNAELKLLLAQFDEYITQNMK